MGVSFGSPLGMLVVYWGPLLVGNSQFFWGGGGLDSGRYIKEPDAILTVALVS